MTRSQLKRTYNILLVVALCTGFALGYWLKGGGGGIATDAKRPPHRAYDSDFPECRSLYLQLKAAYTRGPFRKTDFRQDLAMIDEAIAKYEDYAPFHTLRARILEEWYERCRRKDVADEAIRQIAEQLGLPNSTPAEEVAEYCRRAAIDTWTAISRSPLYQDTRRYGDQWQVIQRQHLNALRRERAFVIPMNEQGQLDLTEAFDCWAITRDHDRYVSNLSSLETGLTYEEKHMADVIYCPQHRQIGFQFPCLLHLGATGGRTIREDVEFFCNAFAVDKQTLDIEDREAAAVHILCFNVTQDQRVVRAALHVEYSDGSEQTLPIEVGPWRQGPELLGDVATRRRLDAAYRDTEFHMCNGEEFEMTTAPIYLYHVTVPLERGKRLDKIGFPRYDPTTIGLEDPGIADARVVAITLQ